MVRTLNVPIIYLYINIVDIKQSFICFVPDVKIFVLWTLIGKNINIDDTKPCDYDCQIYHDCQRYSYCQTQSAVKLSYLSELFGLPKILRQSILRLLSELFSKNIHSLLSKLSKFSTNDTLANYITLIVRAALSIMYTLTRKITKYIKFKEL